jgi:hypothetical protein
MNSPQHILDWIFNKLLDWTFQIYYAITCGCECHSHGYHSCDNAETSTRFYF